MAPNDKTKLTLPGNKPSAVAAELPVEAPQPPVEATPKFRTIVDEAPAVSVPGVQQKLPLKTQTEMEAGRRAIASRVTVAAQ